MGQESDPQTSIAAIQALAKTKKNASLDKSAKALLGFLHDSQTEIRLAAIEALGKIHANLIPDVLPSLLRDQDVQVRQAAAKALTGWMSVSSYILDKVRCVAPLADYLIGAAPIESPDSLIRPIWFLYADCFLWTLEPQGTRSEERYRQQRDQARAAQDEVRRALLRIGAPTADCLLGLLNLWRNSDTRVQSDRKVALTVGKLIELLADLYQQVNDEGLRARIVKTLTPLAAVETALGHGSAKSALQKCGA